MHGISKVKIVCLLNRSSSQAVPATLRRSHRPQPGDLSVRRDPRLPRHRVLHQALHRDGQEVERVQELRAGAHVPHAGREPHEAAEGVRLLRHLRPRRAARRLGTAAATQQGGFSQYF